MDLLALSKAKDKPSANQAILVYGEPKTGKTRFVGTLARMPSIKRIFWFDNENGFTTLLHMGLSDTELAKIKIFRIKDTKDNPIAIETIVRAFSKSPVIICDEHGKIDCGECGTEDIQEINPVTKAVKMTKRFKGTRFFLPDCTSEDAVVIDSGTQLGDSALALACLGQSTTYKVQIDDYGAAGKYLQDILSVMQAATYCHMIMIAHEIAVEENLDGTPVTLREKSSKNPPPSIVKYYPSIGTRSMAMKAARGFGTVIYMELKLNKHVGGSSTTYKANHVTGSRLNVKLEDSKDPCMADILLPTPK